MLEGLSNILCRWVVLYTDIYRAILEHSRHFNSSGNQTFLQDVWETTSDCFKGPEYDDFIGRH